MGSVIVTGDEIRSRLRARGLTVTQLAREAAIPQPHVSAALHGRVAFGPLRAQRFESALVRLGLARPLVIELAPLPPGVFRIRGDARRTRPDTPGARQGANPVVTDPVVTKRPGRRNRPGRLAGARKTRKTEVPNATAY